jgi:hypothetical protein
MISLFLPNRSAFANKLLFDFEGHQFLILCHHFLYDFVKSPLVILLLHFLQDLYLVVSGGWPKVEAVALVSSDLLVDVRLLYRRATVKSIVVVRVPICF